MAAVQIAPVAERAGIATGTVYRYFPAKTELVAGLVKVLASREVAALAEAARAAPGPLSALAAAFATFAARALARRRLALRCWPSRSNPMSTLRVRPTAQPSRANSNDSSRRRSRADTFRSRIGAHGSRGARSADRRTDRATGAASCERRRDGAPPGAGAHVVCAACAGRRRRPRARTRRASRDAQHRRYALTGYCSDAPAIHSLTASQRLVMAFALLLWAWNTASWASATFPPRRWRGSD